MKEAPLWVVHNMNFNMGKQMKEKLQLFLCNFISSKHPLCTRSNQMLPCSSHLENYPTWVSGHIYRALISLQGAITKYNSIPPLSQSLWHHLGHNPQFRNCWSGAFYVPVLAKRHLSFVSNFSQSCFRSDDSRRVKMLQACKTFIYLKLCSRTSHWRSPDHFMMKV